MEEKKKREIEKLLDKLFKIWLKENKFKANENESLYAKSFGFYCFENAMNTTRKEICKEYIDMGFARGLGYAIAQMWRKGNQQEAEYLFNESGLSYKDFEKAEVDEYDLKEIRELYRGIK